MIETCPRQSWMARVSMRSLGERLRFTGPRWRHHSSIWRASLVAYLSRPASTMSTRTVCTGHSGRWASSTAEISTRPLCSSERATQMKASHTQPAAEKAEDKAVTPHAVLLTRRVAHPTQ